nr:hypothetical protein [Cytophagales bacterium]
MKTITCVLSVLLLAVFSQCRRNTEPSSATVKHSPDDPFANTIVPSQIFSVQADRDTVLEGSQGTVLVFPKGCFQNASGQVLDRGEVKIELAEALTLDQMLLSNLTTTADGKPLETDGM